MADKVLDFFQRRRGTKLYKQWVKSGSLRPEDIPQDLQPSPKATSHERFTDEAEQSLEDIPEEEFYRYAKHKDTGLVGLPVRYFFLMIGLIALLLVALAIVSTILVMQSC